MTLTSKTTSSLLALIALMLSAGAVQAAVMEIEFTGLDLVYDGTDIADAADPAGGGGDPAMSDELTSMVFSLDGAVVGTLTADIAADILIPGVAIPVGGGVSSSAGGGFFDLLTSTSTPGYGLALDIASFDITYTGSSIAVFGNGSAIEAAQDLPFGLEVVPGDTVTVTFSALVNSLTEDATFLTSFSASGTGEVRANAVPEPGSMLLSVLGLLVTGMIGLRYRWG